MTEGQNNNHALEVRVSPITMSGCIRREIYLERVRGDSARLHITHLKTGDAGEYECYTPNPAQTYYGTYSGNVRLTVIPDLLRVPRVSPDQLTLQDDDPLILSCEVSSGTRQHTHFSVTWYLTHGGDPHPVVSLSRDSVVSAAPGFISRHQTGEVTLKKVTTTWYQLRMSSLYPTDQAEYYCQATEWIQDPDQSWYPLTTKRSRTTRVHLSSPAVTSRGQQVLRLSPHYMDAPSTA
ncbi:immunoglobulin superfamily member 3-like [Discoglossus pictus]